MGRSGGTAAVATAPPPLSSLRYPPFLVGEVDHVAGVVGVIVVVIDTEIPFKPAILG